MFRKIFALACVALAFGGVRPAAAADGGNALTIYSAARPGATPDAYRAAGYAIVRHDRDIELGKGPTTIRFTDVASQIDPTTVSFAWTKS